MTAPDTVSVSYEATGPMSVRITVSDGDRVYEHDGWVEARAFWKHDPEMSREVDRKFAAWLREWGWEVDG